mmetsp:Transcript_11733/g.13502  ORF Transcript_11733/g.13502 Transcript_11733/m.13502 type:complete len:453 (+) Transcript_11733:289-1647(+)
MFIFTDIRLGAVKLWYFVATALIIGTTNGLVISNPCCHTFEHRGSLFGAELPVDTGALFSVALTDRNAVDRVEGYLKTTNSEHVALCSYDHESLDFKDAIVFIPRGGCSFAEKVYYAEVLGAKAAIIFQSQEPPKQNRDNVIVMAADTKYGPAVTIPSAFVSYETYLQIQSIFAELAETNPDNPYPYVVLNETGSLPPSGPDALPMMWDSMMFLIKIFLIIWSFMGAAYIYNWIKLQIRRKQRRDVVKRLPCKPYMDLFGKSKVESSVGYAHNSFGSKRRLKGGKQFTEIEMTENRDVEIGRQPAVVDSNYSPVKCEQDEAIVDIALSDSTKIETVGDDTHSIECIECDNCVICLCEFDESDLVTVLPCRHIYHKDCIEPWLTSKSALCPMCKQSILPSGDSRSLQEINNAESLTDTSISFEQDQRRTSIALSLGMFMVIVVSLSFMMFDET